MNKFTDWFFLEHKDSITFFDVFSRGVMILVCIMFPIIGGIFMLGLVALGLYELYNDWQDFKDDEEEWNGEREEYENQQK